MKKRKTNVEKILKLRKYIKNGYKIIQNNEIVTIYTQNQGEKNFCFNYVMVKSKLLIQTW